MAEKFGGGVTTKKAATPAPRLISFSELEEFRPLIQYRRDRDTDKSFEILDGMMLKDGYLYKKVPIDALSFCGVLPSEDELLKFEPSKNEESNDLEWLSQLYGEQKKKCTIKKDKGGGKGEGSSSSSMENGFEVHDMVFFSRKGFGVIIGTEKDDSFKVLKEGTEGPVVVNVKLRELKKASFDKKFTVWDHHRKTISINDNVRILEGPLEGRQGIVKQIYRGTVFLYDEIDQENGGYFCSKAHICEKIKLSGDACKEKDGKPAPSGFDDFSSSPKSPLSPKKPWQERDNNSNFNQGDKDGMFSVGQSLRIRVGPLKGYLCRVLALRRSDVMVKLDSQQKILTVKPEHLVAVSGKSSTIPMGDDSESVKSFDLLGTQDGSRGWMDGAGTSTEAGGWTAGGLSTERSSWPAFPASSFSLQPESGSANPLNSMDIDSEKDVEDSAWETKVAPSQNLSWGAAVADDKALANNEQVGGWGESDSGWNKATSNTGFGSSSSDSWGRAKVSNADQPGSSKDAGASWGTAKLKPASPPDSCNDAAPSWGKANDANNNQDGGWKKSEEAWDKGKNVTGNPTSSWSNPNVKNQVDSWGKGKDAGSGGSTWGKAVESFGDGNGKGLQEDTWGKSADKWNSEDDSRGSKAVWNTSGDTPEKEAGGWGNVSEGGYNGGGRGRSGGSGGGRGGYGGRGGGGGGNACYKCGETGHIARDCSQGGGSDRRETGHIARDCNQGGGGGSACYKCGESGHFSRECNQGGGGGGGNACYKCGETGHIARDCNQGGGGGGNACYKCGETGHIARDCNQGGGGGGNACYKCGETGHIARECNQGGGERYGRSSWSALPAPSFSVQPESGSTNPLNSMDNDLTKDVGDSAWGTKVAPSQNLSWGAAVADDKALAITEQVGGWGKSDGGWNKATSDTGFGSNTSDSRGRAKVSTGDLSGSSKDAGASWGTAKLKSASPHDSCNDAAPSWGKNNDANNNKDGTLPKKNNKDGGWKKSEEAWDKGKNVTGNPKSSWNNPIVKTQVDSWGKGKDGGSCESTWGKAVESFGDDNRKGHQEDTWGKAPDKWNSEDGSSGNKASWNTSKATPEKETEGWGNVSGGGYSSNGCGRSGGRGGGRGGYSGRGGGNACYKCGETGHIARDCSQGGGGGGNACFKCGETGHIARDCTQRGGGGGNACYKCGETGHMARDCNQSGGGGGNACYKCGETGHIARDCNQGGGGGQNACYKCGETGHIARDCNQGGNGGSGKYGRSSWSAFPASSFSLHPESGSASHQNSMDNDSKKDVGDSVWGTKLAPSQNSSWGAAVADDKDLPKTEQVGGWGKSDGSWNKATSDTGFGSSTSDSWGRAKLSGGDRPDSAKDAGVSWGAAKAMESFGDGNRKGLQEDTSGKAADMWNSKDGSSGSKAVWNTQEKETGGWGNVSGGGRTSSLGGGRGGYGGRGGGNACYKCGETGHIARDCNQGGSGGRYGGGGGGNGCYKCGEEGHFARECPNSNS